jgi:hypothetical protein
LTIETNCLSGAPIGEREEQTIRWAIDNLSGFIGDGPPPNKPPFIFRRYINGEERAEGIGVETVETLEEAMPIAVRLCPRRPSECAVLVLERLAKTDPRDATIAALRSAVATAREALETCEEVICFQRDKVGCPGEGDGFDRHASEENWPGSWLAMERARSALAALNAADKGKAV